MRLRKPRPGADGERGVYAAELEAAQEYADEWGCPGDMPDDASDELRAEAAYAAETMGLKEPFCGCPFRDALRPGPFEIEIRNALAVMGEGFSADSWRAVLGRDPTVADVEAVALVRRASSEVMRSDDEQRKRARELQEKTTKHGR